MSAIDIEREESLTQEIKRKSARMINAFFDDWFETCKWCKFKNHEHSIRNLKHCWKMLERRNTIEKDGSLK